MKKKSSLPLAVIDLRPLQNGYHNRGIGRYCREILKGFSPPDWRLEGLIAKGSPNPIPEIPVCIQAPKWKRMWLWDQLILPVKLHLIRTRLFHNLVAAGPLDSISFPLGFASRSIATVYDLHLWKVNTRLNRFYRNTKRIRLQIPALRLARQVITISDEVKKELSEFGIKRDKILVIPCGGDHLRFSQATSDLPEIPDSFILSVGDGPNKNLSLIFKLMEKMHLLHPRLQWIAVGAPHEIKNRLVEAGLLTHGSAIPNWLRIKSEVDDAQLRYLYQKAICLLFTSTSEGFGLPIVESMQEGTPVICSREEPMRSIAGEENCLDSVNFLEWEEKIDKMLSNSHYLKEKSREMILRGKTFQWSKSRDLLKELYKGFNQFHQNPE